MPNQQRIKTFFFDLAESAYTLDDQVNKWIVETGCELLSSNPVVDAADHALFLVVRYRLPAAEAEKESDADELAFSGTVVSRRVERIENGTIVANDYCMAGVFPVPEYHALSGQDSETAPMVLLSPDCKLEPYSDWFDFPKDYVVIARLRARPEEAVNA